MEVLLNHIFKTKQIMNEEEFGMNRRRMAGLAAALMLMTFAPINTHAALRRVQEDAKTEQSESVSKSKKDKEKDEES